ncbi:MAG: hypothetical protein ACJ747_05685 [Gaiellaceae bacterium]|jgi:hypothetical protein
MRDDLERLLSDVPAAFPRADRDATERARHAAVAAARRPGRRPQRLGLAAAIGVAVLAATAFTIGRWVVPARSIAATSISIAARPSVTNAYEGDFTFYGSVVNGAEGQMVTVEERACGSYAPFHQIATATTTRGGAFAAVPYTPPGVNTQYRAVWRNGASDPFTVHVRPRLNLQFVSGYFHVQVWGEDVFRGKRLRVERRSHGVWLLVRWVTVRNGGYGPGGFANFAARVPHGSDVRIVLPAAQAGKCFSPSASNVIRV